MFYRQLGSCQNRLLFRLMLLIVVDRPKQSRHALSRASRFSLIQRWKGMDAFVGSRTATGLPLAHHECNRCFQFEVAPRLFALGSKIQAESPFSSSTTESLLPWRSSPCGLPQAATTDLKPYLIHPNSLLEALCV